MAPGNRPALHFTPRSGWINDPLGLTHRDGVYHLYFQHVPERTDWAHSCHWGHATSPDLLHWSERPVALGPGDGDAGCWSGSIVGDTDRTVLFYTSVADPTSLGVGRIRTARPVDPQLDVWTKNPGFAVDLPADVPATAFRDPYVFAEDGRWWMLVGAGLADGTATALVWSSADLDRWEYAGRLAERHRDDRDPLWTGAMWECPQLLRIGDRHVLVVSVWEAGTLHYVACGVGRFADGRLAVDSWHRLSWGESYYAASAFRDGDDRPGLVFWLRGVHDGPSTWAGAISLPYVLTLDGDRPVLQPHPSLAEQRGDREPALAVDATWCPAPGGELRLLAGSGAPVVVLRRDGDRLTVDAGAGGTAEMPCGGSPLRVVLDGPVLEVAGDAGLVAVAVPAGRGTVHPVGDDLDWWSLRG
jgi:beta-fructofuranosidase